MALVQKSFTFDSSLEMKDAGLVATSAAATVDSAAKIIDLGSGAVDSEVVIDISAIETASTDEIYTVKVQGSNSATFSSGIVELGSMELGHATPLTGDTTTTTGRYIICFSNNQNGTIYRYVRIYTVVAGSVSTGINYTAFLVKE